MKFTVRTEDMHTQPTNKGPWTTRRLVLLSDGNELDQQLIELNLPETHPPVGVGKHIDVRVRKVLSVFQGNARVMGEVQAIDGKPVALPNGEVKASAGK